MKKKPLPKAANHLARVPRSQNYSQLISAISSISTRMVGRVATVANQALVVRNWMVGAYLLEFEQSGSDRAKYGVRLLERLAEDLKAKGVKGLDERTLLDCRTFFRLYPQIPGTLSPELEGPKAANHSRRKISGKSAAGKNQAMQKLTVQQRGSARPQKELSGKGVPELPVPLQASELLCLSWSLLQELIRVEDPWKRAFYENECLRGHWSVRQLQRQIESLLYERTGLSTDKKAVIQRARKQELQASIADVLRDPYILEFTGLAELPQYSENELEAALADHVQRFLLELGRGFCFEARQFRMTEGRKHHRVDLVFYHRLLRCHVLIDLKIRAFVPGDAGQMNFYVNWFKSHMMAEGDNPPVGILLCSDKDGTEVEFATAGMDKKLFVARYLTALPSAEQLKAFLDRDRAEIKALMGRK